MEITVQKAREEMIDEKYLNLLIQDYEMGMAYDEESNGFFEKSLEDRANLVSSHILKSLNVTLYNKVLESIRKDEIKRLKNRRDDIEKEINYWRNEKGYVDYETLEGLENELEDVLDLIHQEEQLLG